MYPVVSYWCRQLHVHATNCRWTEYNFTSPDHIMIILIAIVFSDYFCGIALNIEFYHSITSSFDAIAKHLNHPNILKIKDVYKISDDSFYFKSVGVSNIDKKLCDMENKKSQGHKIPEKLLRLAH